MRCRRFHWSLLLLTLTWPVGAQPALAEGVLRVGVAEVDITPPKGFLVAGYYHERLATGTIDPLKARAMVIRTEQVQAALVTCDLTGVAGPLRETAAFTAIECDKIADWVAEHDPEVIGLSDVVDDTIRRRATLNLL